MRSSSLVFLLVPLLLAAVRVASPRPAGNSPDLGGAAAVEDRREHGHGHGAGGGHAPAEAAFYWKVGKFAVWVYSLHHGISPVPALERVETASTRRAAGGGVDYHLVLRVAQLGTCRALVWGVPGKGSQDWKLKYFEPVAGA